MGHLVRQKITPVNVSETPEKMWSDSFRDRKIPERMHSYLSE